MRLFLKNIFEDLFSSVLSQFKRYHPTGNLKFYNLGILKSLKLRILVKKILPGSLKLNFTPNTLGCKGLRGNTVTNALLHNRGQYLIDTRSTFSTVATVRVSLTLATKH